MGRVFIGCEFSGIIREAFRKCGHDAWSCDLLPSEKGGPHLEGDIFNFLLRGAKTLTDSWDLMIFHPPCTHIASSGARWFKYKVREQLEAIHFFNCIVALPAERKAIENPVGIMSNIYRKPDQIIQPWMFGHGETKATCLWLTNLPLLKPTNIVSGREPRVWKEPGSPDRWKKRSRTYQGIADAMADQWRKML